MSTTSMTLKKALKFVGVGAAAMALLLTLTVAYVYFQREKLIRLFTYEINKTLTARVDVGDIDLSLRKFPGVSIAFQNVVCYEALPESKDTLFALRQVYFQFSLWDILRGRYDLKRLSFEQGTLNIRTLPNGKPNYIIWKDEEPASSSLTLELREVSLRDVQIHWADGDFNTSYLCHRLTLNGSFNNQENRLKLVTSGQLQTLKTGEFQFEAAEIPLQASLSLLLRDDLTEIREGSVNLPGGVFQVTGLLADNQKRLHVLANPIRLDEVMAQWPETLTQNLSPYTPKGRLNLEGVYEQQGANAPIFTLDFALREGSLALPNRDDKVQNLSFKGRYYDNGKEDKIQFTDVVAEMSGFQLTGQGSLVDFDRPRVQAQIDFSGKMAALWPLLPDVWQPFTAKGDLKGSLTYQNQSRTMDLLQERPFETASILGTIQLSDGQLISRAHQVEITQMALELAFANRDLIINRLFLQTPQSEGVLTGHVKDFWLLAGDRPGTVLWDLAFDSKRLHADELISMQWPNTNDPNSAPNPVKQQWKLAVRSNQFVWNGIQSNSFQGTFSGKEDRITGHDLRILALGGTILGQFLLQDKADGASEISGQAKLEQVQIRELFKGFDNFGQEVLTSEHISGRGDAQITWRLPITPAGEADLSGLEATLQLVITDGRLQNFAPMENLSKFADMQELRDVRFQRLENQFTIQNRVMVIPEMDIRSNLFDLSIMGTHTFDNEIDYSIKIRQRDIVAAKRKGRDLDNWITESGNENEAFLWVRMSGTVDQPKFGLNKEKNREAIREGIKQQGRELRDKTRQQQQNRQQTRGYQFEWDED
jgi:hypothetical protein